MSDYLSYEPRALVSSSGGSEVDGSNLIFFYPKGVSFGSTSTFFGPWSNTGSYTETDMAYSVFVSHCPGVIKKFWVENTTYVPQGETLTFKFRRYFSSDYNNLVITMPEYSYGGTAEGELPLLGTEKLLIKGNLSGSVMSSSFMFGIIFVPTPAV